MAYLNKIENGYELQIYLWDGKEGSGDIMSKPMFHQFSSFDLADDFLVEYLKEHKPMKSYVRFTNEEELED